jgi:hypothetical protein
MNVEVLYLDGCPNYEGFLPHLRELLEREGLDAPVRLRRVESAGAADDERFLGSPTLRIDGVDVDPGADQRTDFGLKCRLYATGEGLQGTLPDEWILEALSARS